MKVVTSTLAKLEVTLQKNIAFRDRSLRFQLTLIVLLTSAFTLFIYSLAALYTK